MRATDFITEIERLNKGDYEGGKSELYYLDTPNKKTVKQLPGGSGLQYAVKASDRGHPTVMIIDPNAPVTSQRGRYEGLWDYQHRLQKQQKSGKTHSPKVVAKLSLYKYAEEPFKNALKVGTITVDEDYRGMGLAKALYGIVLTIMRKTLVAGGEQTPGGRRNWLSLASIPGVEVKGFVQIDKELANHKKPDRIYGPSDKYVDKVHDNLMNMGSQFMGQSEFSEYWAFDVMPGNKELKQAVNTNLNTLYDRGDAATGMFAVWTGK